MRDWDFWGWLAYGTTFAAAIILAVVQGGKGMTPPDWLPALFTSTRWNYVPLILMLAGGSVFALREFGWIGKTQNSQLKHTGSLFIHRAIYGPVLNPTAGEDETARVRTYARNDSLSILAGHDLLGDPFPGQPKQLTVEYTFKGNLLTKIIREGQWCNLP